MLLFPFYAALYWYLAGRFRRTWKGVGVIFAGMTGIVVIELVLIRLGLLGIAGIEPWELVRLIIPFGVLVVLVAIFIFFLPFPPPPYVHCRRCCYELTGLDSQDLLCPECGTPWTYPSRCPHCKQVLASEGPLSMRCPECRSLLVPHSLIPELAANEPPPGADKQHEDRQPGDEHPADRPESPLAQVRDERH